ncbi:hypothetical protein KI387_012938, partial [Taxus chinensis]
ANVDIALPQHYLTMATKLPYSVEIMLVELARKNGIEPANEDARQALARLGEQGALYILNKMSMSRKKIRFLTGFIFHMIRNEIIPPSAVSSTSNSGSPVSLSLSRADSYVSSFADEAVEVGTGYPSDGERRKTYADEVESIRRKSELPIFTEHLKALGKLDFPKTFLVLSYVSQYV